jgi:hypothetical protein
VQGLVDLAHAGTDVPVPPNLRDYADFILEGEGVPEDFITERGRRHVRKGTARPNARLPAGARDRGHSAPAAPRNPAAADAAEDDGGDIFWAPREDEEYFAPEHGVDEATAHGVKMQRQHEKWQEARPHDQAAQTCSCPIWTLRVQSSRRGWLLPSTSVPSRCQRCSSH